MHEIACLFGALQYAITISSVDFPKEIRTESAFFIGQMVCSTQHQLQVLLSAGGLEALVDFLDVDVENNQDLIFLSLDSLSIIFQQSLLSKMFQLFFLQLGTYAASSFPRMRRPSTDWFTWSNNCSRLPSSKASSRLPRSRATCDISLKFLLLV
jgi:hypothetical protein